MLECETIQRVLIYPNLQKVIFRLAGQRLLHRVSFTVQKHQHTIGLIFNVECVLGVLLLEGNIVYQTLELSVTKGKVVFVSFFIEEKHFFRQRFYLLK